MKRAFPARFFCIIFTLFISFHPLPACAHAFGRRIDLPLSFAHYLVGAAAAIGISFIFAGLFYGNRKTPEEQSAIPMIRLPKLPAFFLSGFSIFRFAFLLLWGGLILSGLSGNQDPTENILPTTLWVLFAVGGTFLAAIFGNWWVAFHPMGILYDGLIQKSFHRDRHPQWWMPWLSLGEFLFYRIVENIFPDPANPRFLSGLLLLYSGISLWGMTIWGKETWLHWADPFGVFFRLLAKCAILQKVIANRSLCSNCPLRCEKYSPGRVCVNCTWCQKQTTSEGREIGLRLWGRELFHYSPGNIGETLFIVSMLSTLAFDGLKETKVWVAIQVRLHIISSSRLLFANMALFFGLLISYLIIYGMVTMLMSWISRDRTRFISFAKGFAFSLLPISVGYEIAHYTTFFAIEGQRIISLLSDPFGRGWNLFGTAGHDINYQIINFLYLWNFQVALIVAGHITAIASSHAVALQIIPSRRIALISQLPIVLLMICYTVFSLWLLSQPLAITK